MTVNEYQYDALRTETNVQPDDLFGRTLQGLLGLGGEAGECLDIFKKYIFQGHDFDTKHLALELGDVAWYLAVTASAIGYTLDDIFRMNIEKRQSRYPEGFDPELSQNRSANDI